MVFSGTRRCKPWSYKIHQVPTFHWFLDINWSLVALLSVFSKLEKSWQPSKKAAISPGISIFFLLPSFMAMTQSSSHPLTPPKLLNVPEVVIPTKLKVKYHCKSQNTLLNLLSSAVASILLLQCYFIITFLVFFHWFFNMVDGNFVLWSWKVSISSE